MRRFIVAVLVVVCAAPAFAADAPKTEEEKVLYSIGLAVARSLSVFKLSPEELAFVIQGVTDAETGKTPAVDLAAYQAKIQDLAVARRKAEGERLAASNKGYLEKAAAEKGAVKTESGLVYLSLKEGTGATPGPTDSVKVNYRGTLPDGTEFDSSYKRGVPADLKLNGVIKCWTEGLQKMKVGGKAKLVCPSSIAYGDRGAPPKIKPGAPLVFDVELLEIEPAKPAAPAAPPAGHP
jgi:FKBP-type peptidyl-prolyl cis-trans isomerase FkpA